MSAPAQHPKPDKTMATLGRRHILQWLWGVPFIAVILQISGILFSYGLPRKKTGTFGTVIDIGSLAEMPTPVDIPLHHSRGRFWLLNNENGLVAIANTCSHLDCLFNWNQEAGCFICPCHGSQFDRQGKVLSGPASRNLDRFPLLVVDADGQVIGQTSPEGKPLLLPSVALRGIPADSTESLAGVQVLPRVQVDTSRRFSGTTILS